VSLFEPLPGPDTAEFAGDDYSHDLDHARLKTQIGRIHLVMSDGVWRTVDEIHAITSDPQASILAQLGHLRKERFGAYLVEKRQRGESRGLYEYRVGDKGAGVPQVRQSVTPEQERALRAADELVAYMQHKDGCGAPRGKTCTCRFDDLRADYREARQATRR
jgi:hypothetical protein